VKRLLIWAGVISIVLAAGLAIARANSPWRHGWCSRGWHDRSPLGHIAHELHLSDAQKAQVKTIWQGERPIFASLVREFAREVTEMQSATSGANADEAKVQSIADRQGQTVAKLVVEKEKLKSKIYSAVLTADQRAQANQFLEGMRSRLDRIADHLEQTGD
jgi:Spy/CpxP family protein refolding chaperone